MTTVRKIADDTVEIRTADGLTITVGPKGAVTMSPPLTPESKPSTGIAWIDALKPGDAFESGSDRNGWSRRVFVAHHPGGGLRFKYNNEREWDFDWHKDCRPIEAPSELDTLRAKLDETERALRDRVELHTTTITAKNNEIEGLRGKLAEAETLAKLYQSDLSALSRLWDSARVSLGVAECGHWSSEAVAMLPAIAALKKREVCVIDSTALHNAGVWKADSGVVGVMARALLKARDAGAVR